LPFDYERFSKIASEVYSEGASPYSLQEVLDVFTYFFKKYEAETGLPHPPLKRAQMQHIIRLMPYIDKEHTSGFSGDIDAESYPALIDAYFHTRFKNCNYRINHFFSGQIRKIKFYETCY